jgi:ABC-2 type transport system ATP-binding protein
MHRIPNPEIVIDLDSVSRSFGEKRVLNGVSLLVRRGSVFGLVGENGAGKTTLIKHLLGLLRTETGTTRVFGLDPVTNPEIVLARLGYLSEERDLPGWMRVDEMLRYTAAFYPTWDSQYATTLREEFGLDPRALVKNLSQGQSAKAGLLLALAHRPELLILDEPSSGLDPVVRRDILEAVIRGVAREGRTVFFSSHLLDEIERVCDEIAMLATGSVVLQGSIEEIKETHYQFTFTVPESSPAPHFPGALAVTRRGRECEVLCNGSRTEVLETARRTGSKLVSEGFAALDEIFVARAAHGRKKRVKS